MPRSSDRIKPGLVIDRQTAATLNRALDLLEALALPRSTDEVGLVSRPSGVTLTDQRPFPETWWISIDGAGVTSSRYEAWSRVEDQGDGSFALADDEQTGDPDFPAFTPPGWPIPAVGHVVLALPSADGSSLLLLTPSPPASGSSGDPVVNNYGPYLTWNFVGPNTYLNFGPDVALTFIGPVNLDFTDVGVVVNLGEVYFQAERVSWSASQNNLALDKKVTFLNVDVTVSGVQLTGIANGANGRLLYIVNRDVLQDLTLVHDSASSAAGNRMKLPVGANVILGENEGIALYYSETDSCWFALDEAAGGGGGLASPLTTKGDVWVYSTTNTRLPVGANGQVLTADSTQATGLKWQGVSSSPLTTKGDVWVYSTLDTRLPVGANGQVLTADNTQATGVKWATPASAPAFSGARVYNSSNQTITGTGFSPTSGAILFASESHDTDGYHSTSSNTSRLTAQVTGYHDFGGRAGVVLPAGETTALLLLVLNGSTILTEVNGRSVAGQAVELIIDDGYHLTAGDYVELVAAIQTGTGNFSVPGSGGVYSPVFWIEYRGP